MLDVHHFYDFTGKVLYTGDGGRTRASALGRVITTLGGTGAAGVTGNNVPALQATVDPEAALGSGRTVPSISATTVRAHAVLAARRIRPSGFISTVAGSPNLDGFNGDNILAINAHLTCVDLVVAPDFSVYARTIS